MPTRITGESLDSEREIGLWSLTLLGLPYTNNSTVLVSYVPGISVTKGGETYYYHHDRLGSTRFLTDSSGDIVHEYDYDAWGNVTAETGLLVQPYQFVGGQAYYQEPVLGLQLLGQRWYDPQVGRFISRDPIGMKGGINLYAYVKNDSVSRTDPFGLIFNIASNPSVQTCLTLLSNCPGASHFRILISRPGPNIYYDSIQADPGKTGIRAVPWWGPAVPYVVLGPMAFQDVPTSSSFDSMCATIAHELEHVAEVFLFGHVLIDHGHDLSPRPDNAEDIYRQKCKPKCGDFPIPEVVPV